VLESLWLLVVASRILSDLKAAIELGCNEASRRATKAFNHDPVLLYYCLHAIHVAIQTRNAFAAMQLQAKCVSI
jgi:hypothetical protein